MVPAELLKPPVTLRQRLRVQGRVSVMGGGTQAGGPLEQGVVLIDEVVNDLTVPAKALHSPLQDGLGNIQIIVFLANAIHRQPPRRILKI